MAADVADCQILIHGSPDGYVGDRVGIELTEPRLPLHRRRGDGEGE